MGKKALLWTAPFPREYKCLYESGKRTKWTPSEYQKQCSCHFETDQYPDPKSRTPVNKSKIYKIFSYKARTCDKYIFTYTINKMINICHYDYVCVFIHLQSRNINILLACACFFYILSSTSVHCIQNFRHMHL